MKKTNNKLSVSLRTILVLSISLLISSCSNYDNNDLIQYVNKVKAEKPGKIDPLPEFVQAKMFTYGGLEIRDPFLPVVDVEVATKRSYSGPRPDANRIKEPLESYSLDSLRMMGSLQQNETTWVLIKDPDGLLHRLKVGNYLGLNNGQIIALAEDNSSIEINELIPDGNGWTQRKAGMAISESK
ncbi:MAG: pilus assembly protein PilP [Gammaproteobacteria bacterium]|nr:pilus assembly protein PilP [Gammaproteobacteria bacterium]